MTYDISGSGFDDATSDMQLQLGGEREESMYAEGGSSISLSWRFCAPQQDVRGAPWIGRDIQG